MKSRLDRYEEFIEKEYRAGLTKPDEYSLDDVTPDLRQRLSEGRFKRIVFTGMGCSAIVSDIVRGYFTEIGLPLEVHVVNDYDFRFLAAPSVLEDEATLYIISSYSGHSQEPVLAYQRLRAVRDQVLLLTSGGKLAELGRADGASIAYWRLREPDREYPLFHVSQYFAILMDMFHEFGVLSDDHHARLGELAGLLEADFEENGREAARRIADASEDANIIMIASPKWHESLLKLAKMHFNEMAMVPTARNYFHEFCHSEVATLSDPVRKHSTVWFSDADDDEYTLAKGENLQRLLTDDRPENRNIRFSRVHLSEGDFLRKYFTALNVVQHAALRLGRHHETRSRDLISESAGNPWYHSTTIESELTA
ncbi:MULTISPECIES: SIS domain-containing protein [Streptomycetaceae]|uniref:SIS domain-containing protein n=1 Tax=Streptomycetaceae TaxID=2062 RepID=UPI00093B893A|nr:SIS domain-containing protein [Streptomyces sp. CB02056]OKH98659.1 hypothetical protein AMK13_36295 [Streptomyces sp. CB02056]